MKEKTLQTARKFLSVTQRRKLKRFLQWPPVGLVWFGSLKRLKPIGRYWGTERGTPVDRYYIESFLKNNSSLIHGHVFEIGDNIYTRKYGGSKVDKSSVLHVAEHREAVTIIGDLTNADHIPSDEFDCIILTQTLHLIYELRPAISTVFRILKPGGAVLCTLPGISQISRYDMDRWGDYWRFTSKSAQRLFENHFPTQNIDVQTYGNVFSSIAFLHGIAHEEIRRNHLDYSDPDYQMLISIKAIKP